MASTFVCPFCPLCCDDLQWPVQTSSTTSNESPQLQCPVAATELEAARNPMPPRIDTSAFDFSELDLSSLRQTLKLSAAPVVAFDQETIEESKELVSWHERGLVRFAADGPLDELHAAARTISRDGVVTATLGDIRTHAETIWLIGECESRWTRLPRQLERPAGQLIQSASVSASMIAGLIENRRNRDLRIDHDAGLTSAEQETILQSNSLAVILTDAPFAEGEAIAAADLLVKFISESNTAIDERRLRRAVLVNLTAHSNLAAVMLWARNQSLVDTLTELPPEIRIGSPHRKHLANEPPQVKLQIGGIDPGPELARCFLPSGRPGIHSAATTLRADGSVTLPLTKQCDTSLPMRLELLRSVIGGC